MAKHMKVRASDLIDCTIVHLLIDTKYLAKTGHEPHCTTLVCICVVGMLLFVLFGCYLCCSV
jgi:hypothetical protein